MPRDHRDVKKQFYDLCQTYDRDGNGTDEAMFRRYNRWHSRFDQPDPYDGSYDLTDPQSFNRYAHVQNDPVNFVDPLGLDRFDDPLGPPPPAPTLAPPPGPLPTITTNTWAPFWVGGSSGDGTEWRTVAVINPGDLNSGPNVTDLGNRLAKMLENPQCTRFVSNLLKAVETPDHQPAFSDLLKAFETVKKQGGVVYGDTAFKFYGYHVPTALGSISNGNAQIELPYPYPNNITNNAKMRAEFAEVQAREQGLSVLHELLHLAGYNDYHFADAVAKMRGLPRPDYTKGPYKDPTLNASKYWDDALVAACKPK